MGRTPCRSEGKPLPAGLARVEPSDRRLIALKHGQRSAALANSPEGEPERDDAAEVSRRRSLKTKGPAAFATGPAIAGPGFEPGTFGL